jgi:hypothetical protein
MVSEQQVHKWILETQNSNACWYLYAFPRESLSTADTEGSTMPPELTIMPPRSTQVHMQQVKKYKNKINTGCETTRTEDQ